MTAHRPVVKVYGERNTGTNYLVALLAANLNARLLDGAAPRWLNDYTRRIDRVVSRGRARRLRVGETLRDLWWRRVSSTTLGWKHMLVSGAALDSPLAREATFVTLTKNPYSWLLSLYDHPYHVAPWSSRRDFERFLQTPWLSVRREAGPRQYETPIELWNQKNRAYIGLADTHGAQLVTYEELVADPEPVVRRIAEASQADPTSDYFTNVTGSAKANRSETFDHYQDYYVNERWRGRLSPNAVALITASLDDEVMRHFGYRFILPS